jgi:hypothetical protein
MPRGIPNKKRRKRSPNGDAPGEVELDDNGQPVVAGELEDEPPSLGQAIEIVRSTLAHFAEADRKRLIRAANMLLK